MRAVSDPIPEGTWFHRSKVICYSEQEGQYLTFDRWTSQAAFDRFRRDFAAEYKVLDTQLEGFAAHETRIGAFRPTLWSDVQRSLPV